jgi:hypothetical protein
LVKIYTHPAPLSLLEPFCSSPGIHTGRCRGACSRINLKACSIS